MNLTEPQTPTLDEPTTGTASHSRRVAAWCGELGRAVQLPVRELNALCDAGLAHHQPELLGNAALGRLMDDLGVTVSGDNTERRRANPLTEEILAAFRDRTTSAQSPRAAELARLLEAANCLDEYLEYCPYEEKAPAPAGELSDEMLSFALRHLRVCSMKDLRDVMPRLPVSPLAAMRLHRLLETDISFKTLETIACSDPVIAGKLVKAANSALCSPTQPIRSVAHAVSHIGTMEARRILIASTIQPLYASPRMRNLWKHSVEAARVTEWIAETSGRVNPAEAFLLGLLHDVGKLAMALLPKSINDSIDRLIARECQPTAAEAVLCGFDHAEAGAVVLEQWKFPAEFIEAVRHHHQPERNEGTMCSALYLTEFWTDSQEDLPSNARMTAALERTLPIRESRMECCPTV